MGSHSESTVFQMLFRFSRPSSEIRRCCLGHPYAPLRSWLLRPRLQSHLDDSRDRREGYSEPGMFRSELLWDGSTGDMIAQRLFEDLVLRIAAQWPSIGLSAPRSSQPWGVIDVSVTRTWSPEICGWSSRSFICSFPVFFLSLLCAEDVFHQIWALDQLGKRRSPRCDSHTSDLLWPDSGILPYVIRSICGWLFLANAVLHLASDTINR